MNMNNLRSAVFGQKVPKYALKVPNIYHNFRKKSVLTDRSKGASWPTRSQIRERHDEYE